MKGARLKLWPRVLDLATEPYFAYATTRRGVRMFRIRLFISNNRSRLSVVNVVRGNAGLVCKFEFTDSEASDETRAGHSEMEIVRSDFLPVTTVFSRDPQVRRSCEVFAKNYDPAGSANDLKKRDVCGGTGALRRRVV